MVTVAYCVSDVCVCGGGGGYVVPRFSHLVVRQTSGGEDGDLLATGDRVHHIDGRDTRLDHLLRVDTRPRVDGLTWWTEQDGDIVKN